MGLGVSFFQGDIGALSPPRRVHPNVLAHRINVTRLVKRTGVLLSTCIGNATRPLFQDGFAFAKRVQT